ncbi:hypothetical protein D1AOALGA4SA_12682 [Olavius algarvensis Delta 1 endosymbiont]|nr:hypothetical protein D1AOALGA4SA_12682 [Olavius algarvensis Delta 1 endosymbiont]
MYYSLLTQRQIASFRPQRSGEPESSERLDFTGFPPSRERPEAN